MDAGLPHRDLKQLLTALRASLKAKGITFEQVAQELGVSGQTIKRFFSGNDVSTLRLLQVCRVAGVDLQSLTRHLESAHVREFRLSQEQEEILAAAPELFALYVLLKTKPKATLASLATEHSLSLQRLRAAARQLEDLQLLERHPGDAVVLLHEGMMSWIVGGPLQRRFMLELETTWYQGLLERILRGEEMGRSYFVNSTDGLMRRETLRQFMKRIATLKDELHEVVARERLFARRKDLVSVKWAFAMAEGSSFNDRILGHLEPLRG